MPPKTSSTLANFPSSVASFTYYDRGTFTTGKLVTLLLSQASAPNFIGTVFVLNGQEDDIFCTADALSSLVGSSGQCGYGADSFSARTSMLFPNAKYTWQQLDQTGHCVNLHETAQHAFQVVHRYLESQGY